jgi:hypothetical protein
MKTYIISMKRIPMLGKGTVLGRGRNSSNPLQTGICSLGKNPYVQIHFED